MKLYVWRVLAGAVYMGLALREGKFNASIKTLKKE
jgi:hypothetical protein